MLRTPVSVTESVALFGSSNSASLLQRSDSIDFNLQLVTMAPVLELMEIVTGVTGEVSISSSGYSY